MALYSMNGLGWSEDEIREMREAVGSPVRHLPSDEEIRSLFEAAARDDPDTPRMLEELVPLPPMDSSFGFLNFLDEICRKGIVRTAVALWPEVIRCRDLSDWDGLSALVSLHTELILPVFEYMYSGLPADAQARVALAALSAPEEDTEAGIDRTVVYEAVAALPRQGAACLPRRWRGEDEIVVYAVSDKSVGQVPREFCWLMNRRRAEGRLRCADGAHLYRARLRTSDVIGYEPRYREVVQYGAVLDPTVLETVAPSGE